MRPEHEFDIHDIIKHYPYFLDKKFEKMTLIHERVYPDRTRADFKFWNEERIVVVEVKKGMIDISMLDQLTGYLDKEKQQNPEETIEGLLVGLPSNNVEFNKEINNCEYHISQRFIGVDVPSDAQQIRICADCRRANWQHEEFCQHCGSSEFIEDSFI